MATLSGANGFSSRISLVCKNAVKEARVHAERLTQESARPRLVVFPSMGQRWDLRANLMAEELACHFGWRTTLVPVTLSLAQRRRILALEKPDVILHQTARHELNRPALYPEFSSVFDLDDADYLRPEAREAIIDCCRDAKAVIAGSSAVAEFCAQYNPATHRSWTGSPSSLVTQHTEVRKRGPVVAWAHAHPLHYKAESEFLTRVFVALAQKRSFELYLYGVESADELPDLCGPLRQAGVSIRTFPFMDYVQFLRTLEDVAVGVQFLSPHHGFSIGKSFGKILAYISAGVSVVASDYVDHPEFFRHGENGLLLTDDVASWASSIDDLLTHADKRQAITHAAREDFMTHLSTFAAAARVDRVLRSVIDVRRNGTQARTARL